MIIIHNVKEVMALLHERANAVYLSGMARFGINNSTALGVKVPELRTLAKIIGKNQE